MLMPLGIDTILYKVQAAPGKEEYGGDSGMGGRAPRRTYNEDSSPADAPVRERGISVKEPASSGFMYPRMGLLPPAHCEV